MIDYDKWLDRINNHIEVQKQLQLDFVNVRYTNRELIELRMMIGILKDLQKESEEQ